MSLPNDYAELRSALRGIREEAQGTWTAWCPGCQSREDGRRGLRIMTGTKGHLVIKCMRGGCDAEAVLAAMSLTYKHLYPLAQRVDRRPRGKMEASYDYRLADGRLLFQVLKWRQPDGSKDFSQRRPNPAFDPSRAPHPDDNPRWLAQRKGMPLCLYRLPELAAALERSPGRWVFLVEGEKAVDFLRAPPWSLLATCNPGGAGKWNCLSFCEALAGRRVLVVADNDAGRPVDKGGGPGPGPLHALDACRSLHGMAAEVRLLGTMPGVKDKGGLDDWLEGRDPAEARASLKELIDAAPPWKPSMEDVPPAVLAAVGEAWRLGMGVAGRGLAGPRSLEEWVGLARRDYVLWEQAAVLDGTREAVVPLALRLAAQLLAGVPEAFKEARR